MDNPKIYYNHYSRGLMSHPFEYKLCPRCKGYGYHLKYDICLYSIEDDITECYICEGLGCVDWIKNITSSGWEIEELSFMEAEWDAFGGGQPRPWEQ